MVRGRVRQRRQRRAPWFASDSVRSFLALALVLVAVPIGPYALVALGVEPGGVSIVVASLFAYWVLFCLVYAGLTVLALLPHDAERFADIIAATTPSPGWRTVVWVINGGGAVSWALTGSGFAIGSVVLLVRERTLVEEPVVVGLAVAVVVTSWMLIALAYAVRYAREQVRAGGIEFPGGEPPRFADFLYVAIQVATTFATSDVTVTSRRMRAIVSVNSVVAFAFNTVIVALLVSTLISVVT
jgi:uncharacterized membrane protein